MILTLTIPGEPIAQPRTKACFRGKHAGVYTPTKNSAGKSNGIAEYKALIRMMATYEFGENPLMTGPVEVRCRFVFFRPGKMIWKKRPMPRDWKITKPDVDNCKKAVLDALKGVVIEDDSQVAREINETIYAAGDEAPHAEITIRQLEAPPEAAL